MEEEKTLTVVAPDGYEIDKEKSTIEKIVFKKKALYKSYEDVAKNLFAQPPLYYTDSLGEVNTMTVIENHRLTDPNNAPTKKQLEWLMSLNKLKNTSIVLNGGWEPDWNDIMVEKWSIYYDHLTKSFDICVFAEFQNSTAYFKTKELARKAIELLGEETIKTALGVYLVD